MRWSFYIAFVLVAGCGTTSEPNLDDIMKDTQFYLNLEDTSALALYEGMNVDIAQRRLREAGFNEITLRFRARASPLSGVKYYEKTRGNPPQRAVNKDCIGLFNSYGHSYYRNESRENDVNFSVVELWQGGMIINGDCELGITKFSPVKTYKIKNILNH